MKPDYIALINRLENTNRIATLYPTTKLVLVTYAIIADILLATVSLTNYQLPILLFAYTIVLLVVMLCSKIAIQGYQLVGHVAIFSAFIAIFQILFIHNGQPIATLGPLLLTQNSLRNAMLLSMNTLNISITFIWFFQTTSMGTIATVISERNINHKISFILVSTFQTIEYLQSQISTIITSQKSRGIRFEGNLLHRMRMFIPIIIPAFITSLIKLEQRVMMLDSRDFFSNNERTHIRHVKHNGFERATLIVASAVLVMMIVGRILLCR